MSVTPSILSKFLQILQENDNPAEKWSALTYIARFAGNGLAQSMTKVQYSELCAALIDIVTNCDPSKEEEVAKSCNSILKDFINHDAILFQLALRVSKAKRLKVLYFLKHADVIVLNHAATDQDAVKFLNDCLQIISADAMEWLTWHSVSNDSQKDIDNDIKILNNAELKLLKANEAIDHLLIFSAIEFLQRLYDSTPSTATLKRSQFHLVVLEKIGTLAYMGTLKQREPALKLLQTAVNMNLVSYIKENHSSSWVKFKAKLDEVFSLRMIVLVNYKYAIWSKLWSLTIQMLGTDAHKNSTLINKLLSVEEKAFKSSETEVRRQAFLCWRDYIDNFALNPEEFKIPKRVKLLCIPLNAKNSKIELIAVTKLEVWWHLILTMFSKQMTQLINSVIGQFLNFCFGPLGDTPFLSKKQNLIASPGKIFYKTKIFAIDALFQLLVMNEKDRNFIKPVLKERLTAAITVEIFEDNYKCYLHSVSEAVIMISNLTENDIENRNKLMIIFWTNLQHYIIQCTAERRLDILKEYILVINEMINHTEESRIIRELILDLIIPELVKISNYLIYCDDTLTSLLKKLMTPSILANIERKNVDDIKVLIGRAVKLSDAPTYHSKILLFIKDVVETLTSALSKHCQSESIMDLWCIIADLMTSYMNNDESINEDTDSTHNLSILQDFVNFPFKCNISHNSRQMKEVIKTWKLLYVQFDLKTATIPSVKHNSILNTTANVMLDVLTKSENNFFILAHCIKSLLETINYERLSTRGQIPALVYLLRDIVILAIRKNYSNEAELAVKSMDAFLISVYGFNNPLRTLSYLDVLKSAIEVMLSENIRDNVEQEIVTTWEHVTIIIQGCSEALTTKMISSFRQMIILARRHKEPLIYSKADSLLQFRKEMKEDVKSMLITIEKEAQLTANESSRDVNITITPSIDDKVTKPVKVVGNFLGNTIDVVKTLKSTEPKKETKRILPLLIDADSQEYVPIKSDPKFDVNKLTEHQKECLKRRREDLAMFNDTSQSASTHTEDLQEWFDRSRMKNESNKENNSSAGDASKPDDQVVNKIESFMKDQPIEMKTSSAGAEISPIDEDAESHEVSASDAPQLIVKRLDFESREEFPDDNGTGQRETNFNTNVATKIRRKAGRPKKRSPDQYGTIDKHFKRKVESDNESESIERKRSRKNEDMAGNDANLLLGGSQSGRQLQADAGKLSELTKREISRLKIDMVADFVFPTVTGRRRSKINRNDESDDRPVKHRNLRSGDKELFELEQSQELIKKRRKRTTRSEFDDMKKVEASLNKTSKSLPGDSRDFKLNTSSESDDKSVESMQNGDEDCATKSTNNSTVIDNGIPENVENKSNDEISDRDELVESSQEPTVLRSPQRRLSERKNDSHQSTPTTSRTLSKKCSLSQLSKKSEDADDRIIDENKIPQDEKPEESQNFTKSNVTNVPIPYATVILAAQSSPQNAQKKFMKVKCQGISPHGRGAHMLGLIPSARPLNRDKSDDDNNKKDIETMSMHKSRPLILKHDKVLSPCGSRQEKIFNNMKIGEFASSNQAAFRNLKNDGEKVSSKMDKAKEVTSTDHDYVEPPLKLEVNASDKELPILEWSSANPPSLTASPSCGILKRHKSLPIETEAIESTSRRKRVSFADPPVSKKMGYEVVVLPSTTNRSTIIRPIRRDLALRLKISRDIGIIGKEHESLAEVDLQRQKDNELLAKIADDLEEEDDVNLDSDTDDNQEEISVSFVSDSVTRTISDTSQTASQSLSISQDNQSDTVKNNFEAASVPVQLNQTDDSILGKILIESMDAKRLELEETVDIRDITSLNSSEITEDIISLNEFERTGTQLISEKSSVEADTLPLPDSNLSSQIMSQCSQTTENSINLSVLEHLDSVVPICRVLVDCEEPLSCIVDKLTNPLWIQHLTSWFAERNIKTIGHLADMSEKAIADMPVKGCPKVNYVKDVLEKFAKTYRSKLEIEQDVLSPIGKFPSPSTSTPSDKTGEHIEIIQETIEILNDRKHDKESLSDDEDITASISHNSSDNFTKQMNMDNIENQHETNDYGSIIWDSTISPPAKASTGMESDRPMIDDCSEASSAIEMKAIIEKMSKEKNFSHEVVKVLGSDDMLKAACFVLGIDNVLPKLSAIYEDSRDFYSKVLNAYRDKITSEQGKEHLSKEELKQRIREKCSSQEISELLVNILMDEDEKGITTSLEEISPSLPILLKRIPRNVIIKDIITNSEIISPSIVLDVGLQNSEVENVAQAILTQHPDLVDVMMNMKDGSNTVIDNMCKSRKMSHDQWQNVFQNAADHMNPEELLDAFSEAMKKKIRK